jgi:hypothetical protein
MSIRALCVRRERRAWTLAAARGGWREPHAHRRPLDRVVILHGRGSPRHRGRTLDFGPDVGFLALAAAQRGHEVVALDQLAVVPAFHHERVGFLQGVTGAPTEEPTAPRGDDDHARGADAAGSNDDDPPGRPRPRLPAIASDLRDRSPSTPLGRLCSRGAAVLAEASAPLNLGADRPGDGPCDAGLGVVLRPTAFRPDAFVNPKLTVDHAVAGYRVEEATSSSRPGRKMLCAWLPEPRGRVTRSPRRLLRAGAARARRPG